MNLTRKEILNVLEYKNGSLFWKSDTGGRQKIGARAGSVDGRYRRIRVLGYKLLEHRLIYFMHFGELPKCVDHKNGDCFDNRIENLQACTHSENMRKRTRAKNNTSGVTGVYKRGNDKYRVGICLNKKMKWLGQFDSFDEAVKVRREAEDKHFGEFIPIDRDKNL